MVLRPVIAATTAVLILSACSAGGGSASPEPAREATSATPRETVSTGPTVPGEEWALTPPSSAGFDDTALRALDRRLEPLGTSCLVVTRHGELVHEAYFGDSDATTMGPAFSVTKSVTSLVVGIAADEGLLDLDDRASDYIPQWKGTAAARVTIRDLLANVSGRHWDVQTDYQQMAIGAVDKTAFAVGLAQDARPGTVWRYNNSAIQTLEAVVSRATGMAPSEYARRKLFAPMQMTETFWGADTAGNTTMFSGINASCRDLARLGVLMLDRGRWGDRQLVSEEYVAEAVGRSSSRLNAAYGLLWWVNRKGPVLGALAATGGAQGTAPAAAGRLAPGVPADAFWALGLAKQIVAVVPSAGIVAVRMGAAPQDAEALTPGAFTRDVLATLG
ncbi:beta-lactamase family protein [Mumia zhuanghuii]|uniref:Serine hydrolase domain-containing protein n=2 Tax=Mumia TaxID=1546255 RepID=A0ABW1QNY9_9ACTN|nr:MULTISPECIES: serine hydrolase domain-containing protein [Mumia]KAA1422224.1 beta-lactamase family protein [Mumia zhuanghuii]